MARLPQYKSKGTITTQGVAPSASAWGAVAEGIGQVTEAAAVWKHAEDVEGDLITKNQYDNSVNNYMMGIDEDDSLDDQLSGLKDIEDTYRGVLSKTKNGMATGFDINSDANRKRISLKSNNNTRTIENTKIQYGIQREFLKKKYTKETNPAERERIKFKLRSLTESTFKGGAISDDDFLRDLDDYTSLDSKRAQHDALTTPELFNANIDSYDITAKEKVDYGNGADRVIKKNAAEVELKLLIDNADSVNAIMESLTINTGDDNEILMAAETMVSNGTLDKDLAKSMKKFALSPKTLNPKTNAKALYEAQSSLETLNNIYATEDDDKYASAITKWKTEYLNKAENGEFSRDTMVNILNQLSDGDKKRLNKGIIESTKDRAWGTSWSTREPFLVLEKAAVTDSDAYTMFNDYYNQTISRDLKTSEKKLIVEDIINEYQDNYKSLYKDDADTLSLEDMYKKDGKSNAQLEADIKATAVGNNQTEDWAREQIKLGITRR